MKKQRIGTICYSHSRGLGHLAKSFIDAKVIDDIYVVKHSGIPMKEWYPNAPVIDIREMDKLDRTWINKHTAMLFFETPFSWQLITYCKSKGIRTYLMTMYECSPNVFPVTPDVLLCPSALDMREFESQYSGKCRPCSIPVDGVPFRLRTNAHHFIHNGGYLGMRGREGTELLIEAMTHVASPIRLTIRVQENVSVRHQLLAAKDSRIDYIPQSVPYEELYAEGDVSILPQKFNGMSMPLLESRASGMLVMTTNRFPANEWLPTEPMIPVECYHSVRLSPRFRVIQEAQILPKDIAQMIDSWYGRNIEEFSLSGKEWAKANSWKALREEWERLLSC